MKGIKSRNGITLIALIITIIVLIVLAIIAIAAVQDSGIFLYANRSAIMHEVGTLSEIIRLESQEIKLESAEPGATQQSQNVENSLKRLYGSQPTLVTVKGATAIPETITDGKYYLVTPEKLGVKTKRGQGTDSDIFVVNENFEVFYIVEMDGQPFSIVYEIEPDGNAALIRTTVAKKGSMTYEQFIQPYLTNYSNMSPEEKEQFKQQSIIKAYIRVLEEGDEMVPPELENAENVQVLFDFMFPDENEKISTYKAFLAFIYNIKDVSEISEEDEINSLLENKYIAQEEYYGPTYARFVKNILKDATDEDKERIFREGAIYDYESQEKIVPDEAKLDTTSFQRFVLLMQKIDDPTMPDEAITSMPSTLKEFAAMVFSIEISEVTDEMVNYLLISTKYGANEQEHEKEKAKYPGSAVTEKVTVQLTGEDNFSMGPTDIDVGQYTSFSVTKNGYYTIIATDDNGVTLEETVYVNVIPELLLDKTELTIDMFKSAEGNLSATITNVEGQTVTWTNSNSDIVEMTIDGNNLKLTGKRAGIATITAKYNNLTTTCEVTVTDLIGKFVEYDVEYTDVFNNNNYYTKANGWRVFDYTKNADGSLSDVKLISTGIPGKVDYGIPYNYSGGNWPIIEDVELNRYLKEVEGIENPQFSSDGANTSYRDALRAAAGLYYNFGSVKFMCAEEFNIDINLEGIYKLIKVAGVTYDEKTTTEIYGNTLFNLRNDTTIRLLAINEILDKGYKISRDGSFSYINLQKGYEQNGLINIHYVKNIPNMSNYTYSKSGWILATREGYQDYLAGILDGYNYGSWVYPYNGVRPLICFNSSINLVDSNNDGVYEIK